MAKIQLRVGSEISKFQERIGSMVDGLNDKNAFILSALTQWAVEDISPLVPVDTGETQMSAFNMSIYEKGIAQWVRIKLPNEVSVKGGKQKAGDDVIREIYETNPTMNHWIEKWIASGGTKRLRAKYIELFKEYSK